MVCGCIYIIYTYFVSKKQPIYIPLSTQEDDSNNSSDDVRSISSGEME